MLGLLKNCLCFVLILLSGCIIGKGGNEDISEFASLVLGQSGFESSDNNSGASSGQASASSLSSPQGIFFDGTRLYIADTNNNRVLIWTSAPSSNNQASNIVIGQANATDNSPNQGGTASCATLSSPTAVHVNGNRLFIADSGNNRVLVFNNANSLSTGATANFVIGHGGSSACSETRSNQLDNDKTGARSDTLNNPTALFFDGSKLFVADTNNHRVLIYNSLPSGHGHEANVALGQTALDQNTLGAVSATTLNKPGGVYVTNGKILVSDTGFNRVLVFNSIPTANNGQSPSANVVIGQTATNTSTSGVGAALLSAPAQISGDEDKKILIADKGNHRVVVFNGIPTTNGLSANEVMGQDSFTSSSSNRGTTAKGNTLNSPSGVSGHAANFWVSDTLNHRALRF